MGTESPGNLLYGRSGSEGYEHCFGMGCRMQRCQGNSLVLKKSKLRCVEDVELPSPSNDASLKHILEECMLHGAWGI